MLAIAALASCAKEETLVADQGELIGFNSFVENSTRAADKTYSGETPLKSFRLFGTVQGAGNGVVNIYNDVTVTGEVGQNVWTCPVNQYWIAGAEYNFAAVVDADAIALDVNKMPVSLTYKTAGQKDLLYASVTETGKASGNDKVNFNFAHLLSKAQFTVTSNTADGYFHKVTNIKVQNFEQGTYTIGAETPWSTATAAAEDVWISFGNIDDIESTDNTGVTNDTQMLLLPTTTDFKVTFTVEIWNGTTMLGTQDYTKTVTQDLVAGYAYNFNLALSVGELIQFTVTSDPSWTPNGDTTLTL